jgi:hypothetical protein
VTYEEEIIARHSRPSLKKTELTRSAKKDHLAGLGIKGEEAEKILALLYPNEVEDGDKA